jgi:hypothetical protein
MKDMKSISTKEKKCELCGKDKCSYCRTITLGRKPKGSENETQKNKKKCSVS